MAENIVNFNNDTIVVDDGSVRVSIHNKYGDEIGVFKFRPTDIDIIRRYNEIAVDFESVIAPLEHLGINPDGTAASDDIDDIKILEDVKIAISEKVDYLFAGNASEAFFEKMHPFSIINGSFYCENMLEAVGEYISKAFNRETKNINKRMNRYTHGYRTGRHKNGGKKGSK